MNTIRRVITGLFALGALTLQAQNVASTADVTSGGLEAGSGGTGNAFYGYQAGKILMFASSSNNTFIGNLSGSELTQGFNNVFIGFGSGLKPIDFRLPGGSGNIFIGSNASWYGSTNNKLIIDNSDTDKPLIWGDFAEDWLKFNGKVGIGYDFGDFPATAGTVDVEDYNLFVNGGILTEEVRVMLKSQWADYVFEEGYNLPKLEEVEVFIKENKHLPNVPSAREVKENGIELGEITKIQQEKIEELTLYLIQQQKEINELKEQVKLLLENK